MENHTHYLDTQPYKGTRDFYPPDFRFRAWMFQKMRNALHSFGYEEYDGPLLEPFELYASKTSEEIVNKQLYSLVDQGNRKLALRPEMTPTLARMVAQKIQELPKPIRWFSLPNLWRYERPQKGRLREHWQLNADVFGGEKALEDLEIFQVVIHLFNQFGANEKHFEIKINHRGITDFIFRDWMQLHESQIPVVGGLLDAAPKMGEEKFKQSLEEQQLSGQQIDVLLSIIRHDEKTIKEALSYNENYLYLMKLIDHLDQLGLRGYVQYDPSIMRGFLYYTGVVFEVFDRHPENRRALMGGGRYDNLVGLFGKNILSGVGFGMGDVTFRNFLEAHGLAPKLEVPQGVYIAHLTETEWLEAQKVAQSLRQLVETAGLQYPILTALSTEKFKKIFSAADKLNARFILFVGSDEIQTQEFKLKDLVTGEQNTGQLAHLLEHIKNAAG